MRRTVVAAAVAAALVGAGAGAAVTAYDDDDWRHPMGSSSRWDGPMGGGPGAHMGGGFGTMGGFGHMGDAGRHVSASSEREYLVEMVAHHREAIASARELGRSDRATMRDFGERIVEAQSAQVEQMEGWLAEWYPDESTDADYDPMMRDLSDLSGDRLDRAFLEDMVWHHMAAVMMSQHLLVSGLVEHDEVADLAADIRDEQREEIFQMRVWLRDWFDVRWMH